MATNQKQEVELLIKAGTEGLKSIGQLVEELKALGQDTGEASEQLGGLATSLKSLRDQQKLVKQFADLKSQTKGLSEEQEQARDRATQLGQALAKTEKPTRAQRNEFEKAKKASRDAQQAWQDNQRQLNDLRNSLNDAGISTRDLASEQQRIKREISGVDDEIRSVASELTQLRDNAQSAASGTRQLGADVEQSGGRVGKFRERLAGLNPVLGKVGSGLKSLGVLVAGAAAAIGASVATISLFSKGQARLADELTNTSNAIGVNREALQLWRIAGERVGLSGEKVSEILKSVTERLGEFSRTGGGEAAEVMDTLNLKIRDFRNLNPDEQLLKLGQAIGELGSKSEQVALLEKLASDASQLQPLLDDNAAGLRAIFAEAQKEGAIYTEDELDKLTRANDIYNTIDLKLKALTTRIGSQLAPAVSTATDQVLKLFDQGQGGEKLVQLFQRLIAGAADFATGLIANQDKIAAGFSALGNTVQFLGNVMLGVFRGVQGAAAGLSTVVAAALTTMLTIAEKVVQGLNAIGVVGDQAYANLKAKADAAAATTAELARQTADFGKKAWQAGEDAFAAFDDAEKGAGKVGEKVEETVGTLTTLAEKLETVQPKITDALEDQERAASRAREELQKMGVDAGAALEGISAAARESIGQLSDIADEIETIGSSSEKSADVFRDAITNALGDVSTAEEFQLIDQQVRELFGEGKIDNRALQKALIEIRERQKEIGEQNLSKGVDDLKDSAVDAAEAIETLEEKIKRLRDEEEQEEEERNKFRAAWGAAFAAALSNAREQVTALSKAARNLYETRIGGNAFVEGAVDAAQALEQARQRVDELATSSYQLRNNSFAEWFTNIALQAARIKEAFYEQKIELDNLTASVQSGSFSMEQLANLSERAAREFDLLDAQQLTGLQSAIDQARNKIESLNSSAESTLNSLRQRLADISGDAEEAQRLQYESERARLEEQLRQARAAGASEAAADYSDALSQLEKIYQLEQKKAREAAQEREAEKRLIEDRERLVEEQGREQSVTTDRQGSQQQTAATTIILQGPQGGNVEVQTTDPDGLLGVLEQAGLRSSV